LRIALHPYAKEWPVIYRYEEHLLTNALNIPGMAVEHIGSTAVPGLAAKAVIDIIVGIPWNYSLEHVVEPMLDLGYVYGRYFERFMPDRRLFIRMDDNVKFTKKILEEENDLPKRDGHEHTHIHVIHRDSEFWNDTIRFRNHLRKNAADRLVYELLKKQLAENEWESITDYTTAKGDFIKMILLRSQD
jgi:GrpB-like predicted nucleotidyltransferase (UPF0157 family)